MKNKLLQKFEVNERVIILTLALEGDMSSEDLAALLGETMETIEERIKSIKLKNPKILFEKQDKLLIENEIKKAIIGNTK
jgi:biotin operon repressor